MPGGSPAAWPHVKPIFQAIAAKVKRPDGGEDPCCDWVGENGAGHYVKMVHNGIEYGDMQLICEAYHLMKEGLGMSAGEMHKVFAKWNKGKLDSYLIEITRDILGYKDADGKPLVDKILDTAGQKGTGKWTGISALDMGIPLTMVVEAVLARSLSALKDERVAASKVLSGPKPKFTGDTKAFVDDLQEARLCLQDHLLHPGLHADAGRGARVQVESQLRRHRADVARRLHHPLRLPGQDQGSVRQEPAASATCCSTPTSKSRSKRRSPRGGAWWPRPSRGAFRSRPCPAHWRSTTAIAANGCPPTCSRRSATISARTPMSAWTSRAASSSTPTGPGAAAM